MPVPKAGKEEWTAKREFPPPPAELGGEGTWGRNDQGDLPRAIETDCGREDLDR
jgi:hypothetical protein